MIRRWFLLARRSYWNAQEFWFVRASSHISGHTTEWPMIHSVHWNDLKARHTHKSIRPDQYLGPRLRPLFALNDEMIAVKSVRVASEFEISWIVWVIRGAIWFMELFRSWPLCGDRALGTNSFTGEVASKSDSLRISDSGFFDSSIARPPWEIWRFLE